MCLWLRARRWALVAGAVVVALLVTAVLGRVEVRVVAVVGGGSGPTSPALLAPLLVASALASALDTRQRPQERAAARRIWVWDQALVVGTVVTTTAGLGLAAAVGVPDVALAWRNLLLLCGVAVVAVVVRGVLAAAGALTALVLVTFAWSPYLAGAAYVRVLQVEGAWWWAGSLAAGLLAAGSLAIWLEGRLGLWRC